MTAIPATGALPPGHQYARIVELCRTTRAVAELAARVDVPVAVMAAMVAELRESGWVSVGEPLDLSGDTVITTALLERIRDGLLRHAY